MDRRYITPQHRPKPTVDALTFETARAVCSTLGFRLYKKVLAGCNGYELHSSAPDSRPFASTSLARIMHEARNWNR